MGDVEDSEDNTDRVGADTIDPAIVRQVFEEWLPFNKFLGIRVLEAGGGRVRALLPYRPEIIGNPEVPALHGGAIATLLDAAGGVAVFAMVRPSERVSTIDIRIDYLRMGRPEPLVAVGEVMRLGNRVGVVSLRAFHLGCEDEIVAAAMGAYSIRRSE